MSRIVFLMTAVIVTQTYSLAAQRSAWELLLRESPEAADDRSISWQDRLILHALTPDQAQSYFSGRVSAKDLILPDGQSLALYLEQKLNPKAHVYIPLLSPCSLFALEGPLNEGQRLESHRDDLRIQGGSSSGCSIAEEAAALLIQVQVESPGDLPAIVKLWSPDGPEPASSLPGENALLNFPLSYQTTFVVPVCSGEGCRAGEFALKISEAAAGSGDVVGYFRPLAATDQPGDFSFATEGLFNNFFGFGAGTSITTGSDNAFFGGNAGNANTSGDSNSFFGGGAGFSNTSGSENAFFGRDAGLSNTTASNNSFFGRNAGRNNTACCNSFFGYSAGINNTTGGNNAFFGWRAGHANTTGGANAFFGSNAGLFNTTGGANAFFGYQAGVLNTTGLHNSFFGQNAGGNNTTGSDNSFFGGSAGALNTTASSNSFFGANAGSNNTTGTVNSFFGGQAGQDNMTGSGNSFFGRAAGRLNTTGFSNSFFGQSAGFSNTTGSANSFFGELTGFSNSEGFENSFFGESAGFSNTSGPNNSFFGHESGVSNTTGFSNSFFGGKAGSSNTIGGNNNFFGNNAGFANSSGSQNVFIGSSAGDTNTSGSNNTSIGVLARGMPEISNAIALGYLAQVSQPNSLVLGSISGVNGAATSVKVGIGTDMPAAPLHVQRADGTVQIIRAQSTGPEAVRNMMDLMNNGIPQFRLVDTSADGNNWQISNTNSGLNISLQGSGAQELLIEDGGDVFINNGTVQVTSSRETKENFKAIDSAEILNRIADLDISEWNYIKDADSVRHFGPVSEDFYALFGLGEGDKHVTPTDLSGLALAAIQGLLDQNERLQSELSELRQQFEDFKKVPSQRVYTDLHRD